MRDEGEDDEKQEGCGGAGCAANASELREKELFKGGKC